MRCRIYSLVSVSNYLTFQVWGDIFRGKQKIQVVTELELMITESEFAKFSKYSVKGIVKWKIFFS